MKFHINLSSFYPPHEQLKEQIRLAISLGHFGPGYALPSIRELERELGVGRAIIHQAYRELAESGILLLRPRKGAVVSPTIVSSKMNHRAQKYESYAQKVLRDLRRMGFLERAFAASLYQKAITQEEKSPPIAFVHSIHTEAVECAEQITESWGTKVMPITRNEFSRLKRRQVTYRWILTPFYEYEFVARSAKRFKLVVGPVVLRYSREFIVELASKLERGKVLFILADADFERHGDQLVEEVKEGVKGDKAKMLVARALSRVRNLAHVAKSGKYEHVYVGNRIWDSLDSSTKHLPMISHPSVEVAPESLQQVKLKLGLP